MRPSPRNTRGLATWMLVVIAAGLVIVISALVAAGGDITATIDVRGGSIPALLVMLAGITISLGGVAGLRATRDP